MRIMVTGGGTGGHTSPGVAIIEELQRRDPRLDIQWVGRRGGIEERLCQGMAIPFRALPVEGWPRKLTLRKVWVAGKLALAGTRALLYVRKFRPQLVIGMGGYVSVPLVWVAQRLAVPTVLHEQNRKLGMANRCLATGTTRIFLSYPDTVGDFPREKARVVGNPVRAVFASPPDKKAACAKLGLDDSIPVVLISGGSQGAQTLNAAIAAAFSEFQVDEAQFIWIAGAAGIARARRCAESVPARVSVFSFVDDMVTAYAAADLVVSRAGASSTAEIALLGKPSILVPYPHATDNHQEENARAFGEAGAAVVLLDRDCSGACLVGLMRELLGDRARLSAMADAAASLARPGAAEAIVEDILALVFGEADRQ